MTNQRGHAKIAETGAGMSAWWGALFALRILGWHFVLIYGAVTSAMSLMFIAYLVGASRDRRDAA